jgi:exopolysaccharide biosynthesis WecB/TagA/CpsF family protein
MIRNEPIAPRAGVDDSAAGPATSARLCWPPKYDVFHVQVSATTYEETVEILLEAAARGLSAVASFYAVDALVGTSDAPALRDKVNRFQIVAPDGQPVRWALNLLHGLRLRQPVCGTDLMWMLCGRAAESGVPIYLYGGTPAALESLQSRLRTKFPALRIAGAEAPPFRPLTAAEDDAVVQRVNRSGARLLFVGLGYPKQDEFAIAHRGRVQAVQLCVGAAFDFLSGHKRRAPAWMRRLALEWLYRFLSEPKRLWRRYLIRNTHYGMKLALALACKTLRIDRAHRDCHSEEVS